MSRSRGFSLLEVLVSVALFALAMGLAYGGLDAVVRGRAQLEAEAERLAGLQRAIGMLERDLRAALPRGVRATELRREPALLLEGDGLALTRAGHANRLAQPRAELERVIWQLDDGALVRLRYAALDRGNREDAREDLRLDAVGQLRIEALATDGRWASRWPRPGEPADALPRALRIEFQLDGVGRIERVLEVAGPPAS